MTDEPFRIAPDDPDLDEKFLAVLERLDDIGDAGRVAVHYDEATGVLSGFTFEERPV